MRKAKLSGIYYKSASTLLDKQISEAFEHKKGPGALPVLGKERTEDLQGIIVPKYSYDIAGPCMAWGYSAIAEKGIPDVFVIIGQSKTEHSGITTEPFETPYGMVRVDQPLARAIIEKGHLKENNPLFDEDELIESQLPFIQYTFKKNLEKIKILPVLVGTDIEYREAAADIKEALMEKGKKAVILVPTNFTHYGSNIGYIPFSEDAHKQVVELDEGAIEFIKNKDPKGYLDYVDDKAMNSDNYLGVIMALLMIKPGRVLLEQYYTTSEFNEDYKNFTSFGTIILERK